MKVWWRYNNSDINGHQKCIKIPKKRNKIKWRSITYSHIWHINIPKCVYWLDIRSVKVWCSYDFPNTNAAHFCDIISSHRTMFPSCSKNSVGNQSGHVRHNYRIIYLTFSKYSSRLYKLGKTGGCPQTTDRIPGSFMKM